MEGNNKKPYNEMEKMLLASLVMEHGRCIENKKTDGSSIQEKQKAWDYISQLYNMQPETNCSRSAKQLKKLWDNLKQRKRKDLIVEKHFRLLTGGGPQVELQDDPLMELVDAAAPRADVTIDCDCDSTAVHEKKGGLLHIRQPTDASSTPVHFVNTETVKKTTAMSSHGVTASTSTAGGASSTPVYSVIAETAKKTTASSTVLSSTPARANNSGIVSRKRARLEDTEDEKYSKC